MGVHTDEFALLLHIGDNVVDGHLSRGSGRGGNGDDGDAGLLSGGNALQAPHVLKLRVGDDDADGLGRIHGGASSDGYNVVRSGSLKGGYAGLHILNGGIGFDVGVNLIVQPSILQHLGHLGGYLELNQIRVRAYERFVKSSGLRLIRNLLDGSHAVVGGFI